MKGNMRNTNRSPYRGHNGRQPTLTISLGPKDIENFEGLREVLQKNHLMNISRSFTAKYALALGLHVCAKADREGNYEKLAGFVMEALE